MSFLSRGLFFKGIETSPASNMPTLHQYFDGTVKGIVENHAGVRTSDRRFDENPQVVASKLMALSCEYAAAGNPSPMRREEGLLQACHDARVSFWMPLNHHVICCPGDAERIKRVTFGANF